MTDKIATFTIRDVATWEKGLANNTDPYGRRIYTYAADWANLMEAEMAKGAKLEDVAERCGRMADTDGITGFMYGAAVSTLSHVWKHGEALRRWHNATWGVKDPDAKGTVNPAVINVTVSD